MRLVATRTAGYLLIDRQPLAPSFAGIRVLDLSLPGTDVVANITTEEPMSVAYRRSPAGSNFSAAVLVSSNVSGLTIAEDDGSVEYPDIFCDKMATPATFPWSVWENTTLREEALQDLALTFACVTNQPHASSTGAVSLGAGEWVVALARVAGDGSVQPVVAYPFTPAAGDAPVSIELTVSEEGSAARWQVTATTTTGVWAAEYSPGEHSGVVNGAFVLASEAEGGEEFHAVHPLSPAHFAVATGPAGVALVDTALARRVGNLTRALAALGGPREQIDTRAIAVRVNPAAGTLSVALGGRGSVYTAEFDPLAPESGLAGAVHSGALTYQALGTTVGFGLVRGIAFKAAGDELFLVSDSSVGEVPFPLPTAGPEDDGGGGMSVVVLVLIIVAACVVATLCGVMAGKAARRYYTKKSVVQASAVFSSPGSIEDEKGAVAVMNRGRTSWPDFPTVYAAMNHISEPNAPPIPAHLSNTCADFLRSIFVFDAANRPTAKRLLAHNFLQTAPY
eukprot:gene1176-1821_t